jgi:LacI family transcriptional regulator
MGKTIEDIAKAAGVSSATVSRVLNNPGIVRPETIAKVTAVIDAYKYKPNIFARGLMRSRTDSVGIIVPNISNPYFMTMVETIEITLARNGTHIYLCNSQVDPHAERGYLEELVRRNVDAVVVVEAGLFNGPDNYFLTCDAPCPIILVNEHLTADTHHHIVRCDQSPGLIQALAYFIAKRLLPIALVNSESASYSFTLKNELLQRFAVKEGLSAEDTMICKLAGDPDHEEIVSRAAESCVSLLGGPRPPRAILAGNELMAVGVLQGALSCGARVPEDLAVIGVDNTILSRIGPRPLSTVDLRPKDVGKAVADLYLRIHATAADAAFPARDKLDSYLIHRSTTERPDDMIERAGRE